MHPALCIDEILREIFAHVATKDDLRGMALACRTLYEPVMDDIWTSPKSLEGLIRCLPEELLDDIDVTGLRYVRIARVPSLAQWTRFRAHAHRVRSLELAGCERPPVDVDESFFDIIRHHYPEPHLFPNLQRILCRFPYCSPHLDLLVQPTLQEVSFTLSSIEDIRILDSVKMQAPALQKFRIYIFPSSPRLLSALSRFACSFNFLKEVSWAEAYDETALRKLSELPYLEVLALSLGVINYTPLVTCGPEGAHFPSLQSLYIVSYIQLDSPGIAYWLRSIRPPRLRTLDLKFYDPPTSHSNHASQDHVEQLCSAIATYPTLQDLKITHVYAEDYSSLNFAPHQAHHVLLPLVEDLPHIRHLRIHNVFFSWTPLFVRKLASSWPGLVSLTIENRFPESAPAGITLSDLSPFAEFCPALRTLAIRVSPHMPAEPPDNAHAEVKHGLQELNLDPIVFESNTIPHVAAFLDRVFPFAKITKQYELNEASACLFKIDDLRRVKG